MDTPYYLFDENILLDRIRHINLLLKPNFNLCYSIKANPFLIDSLLHDVDQLEVCSPGEMKICMARKVPANKILMSGVNKTVADIKDAFAYGVCLFSLESKLHYQRLKEVLATTRKQVKVYLRLSSGNQFGMSKEDINDLLAQNDKKIKIIGIHYFAGTQRKKIKHQEEELLALDQYLLTLEERYKVHLSLEYGPGLAVPLFVGDDFQNDLQPLSDLLTVLNNLKHKVTIEMGRFMTYNCGSYVTEVQDIKTLNEQNIVILDGGIHHLNYYGQMMGMKIPHIKSTSLGEKEEYCLCGSLCTTADVLVRKVELAHLNICDRLTFENCGAYSVTESMGLFLSRKLPAVYLKQKNGIIEIRKLEDTFPWNTRR